MSRKVEFMFEDDHGWVSLSFGDNQFIGECSYIKDILSDLANALIKLKEGSSCEYLLAIYEPKSDLIELNTLGENVIVRVFRFGGPEEISWSTNSLSQYAALISEKVPDSEFTLSLKSVITGFLESFEKIDPPKYYEQWGHAWPSSLLRKLSA